MQIWIRTQPERDREAVLFRLCFKVAGKTRMVSCMKIYEDKIRRNYTERID